MARYIDADKVLNWISAMADIQGTFGKALCHEFSKAVRSSELPDVEKVVRCKECIYWENGKGYTPYCNHPDSMLMDTNADDFCSYGERKER